MKRGFYRARKNEPEIKAILDSDTTTQEIGLLAQAGVYELHKTAGLLEHPDAVETVSKILQLDTRKSEVRDRIYRILVNYQINPILKGKTVKKLMRGDEGFPQPIKFSSRQGSFNLFAAIDCIFLEDNNQKIHILDFKTGHSQPDKRQALVYLLVGKKIFHSFNNVASFYNLETCKWTGPVTATDIQLKAIQSELYRVSRLHDREKKKYRRNPKLFNELFPPNPGYRCSFCQFSSICQFSVSEEYQPQ